MGKPKESSYPSHFWSTGPSPGSATVLYSIVQYLNYMFIDNSFVPTAALRVDFILLKDN